ncbi:hypothetical protein HOLleu_13973 [Holothuria leucospilota]|uniref:Uncharacterized protein n=1 Tax=Holothuria leucospilota TaxID=206669 RepID=A0A9Q1C5U9_HOLLE|nr:hypothetical protein HOLleu_13973 [Holothuria leucospilota]
MYVLYHTPYKKPLRKLAWLESLGIIEPGDFIDWSAPIAPVMKTDNAVGIYSDYKWIVNTASKLDRYPIPKIENLLRR